MAWRSSLPIPIPNRWTTSQVSISSGSAPNLVAGENDLAQNPWDLEAEYGRSLFDARQRFVFSYQWQLPFWQESHNWYQRALGNWQLNGIFSASTGTPFTVYDSSDPSLQGQSPEISGFVGDRPNLVGNPNNGPKTASEWFNTQAFQQNTQLGTFGNAGRNIVQAAGLSQWDFAALQEFSTGGVRDLAVPRRVFQYPEPGELWRAQ